MRICVYCSSSSALAPVYQQAASELGRLIGIRGHELVYGGSTTGTMGLLADAARQEGARVTGVIPERMVAYGIADQQADELIVTATMAERKEAMESRAEAFVALPGGFGTLEELLQVLTLKQLGYHDSPIAMVSVEGIYGSLLAYFEALYDAGFAKPAYRQLYCVTASPQEAIDHVESYRSADLPDKWFL